MPEPWELRLDRALWTPTALGTVGPGLLYDVVQDGDVSYRPLLRTHLAAGLLKDRVRRAVEVVEDSAGWDRLADEPSFPPALGEKVRRSRDDDRAVAVVLRDRMGELLQCVLVGRADGDIARLRTFWVWNAAWLPIDSEQDILAAGWLSLFRSLAQRGAVAVTAPETSFGRRYVQVLRDVAGFRPTRELYTEVGLSPAESTFVLAEWRATIEDRDVVRFATHPELDEAAHRELLEQLARHFARDAAEVRSLPDFRQTLRGEVHLDGPHAWGSGPLPEDDWYAAPPDRIPEELDPYSGGGGADLLPLDWTRRGPAVLGRWLAGMIEG